MTHQKAGGRQEETHTCVEKEKKGKNIMRNIRKIRLSSVLFAVLINDLYALGNQNQ